MTTAQHQNHHHREHDLPWYHPDGSACARLTGSSTGLPRPVTVKDARTLGLLPSATNVLSVLARPALEHWKQQNAILASLNTPRAPYEPEAAWHGRIAEEAERLGAEGAGWGAHLRAQVSRASCRQEAGCLEPVLSRRRPCT